MKLSYPGYKAGHGDKVQDQPALQAKSGHPGRFPGLTWRQISVSSFYQQIRVVARHRL